MGGAYFRFELTVFRLGPLYSAIPFLPLFQLCKVCVTALVIFQETLLNLLLTKINEFCLQWTLILNILPHYLNQVGGSQKKVEEEKHQQGVSPHAENASRAPMHHGVLPPLCRKCTVVVNNFDELCDPVAAKLEAFILIKKRNPHCQSCLRLL